MEDDSREDNNIINQAEYNRDIYRLNLNMDIYPARKQKNLLVLIKAFVINRNPSSSSDYIFQFNANQAMQMKMRSEAKCPHSHILREEKKILLSSLVHLRTMHIIAMFGHQSTPMNISPRLLLILFIIINMYFVFLSLSV